MSQVRGQTRRHGALLVTFRWHAWALPLGVMVTRGYWSVAFLCWTFEYLYHARRTP